ncbi:calmodulin 1 [Chlorella sorokiniana]|uniref:Calmodulin 1 n=1 Tax=Chlorella sorokiniana TaxID=3076 RepID=A0A2P6TKG0_CHLSO|nr:calmodulin 1 [Chlorella sorokiniana]|eukprot:PRW44570.1 calmodulin 1 [Chlorella sorokiniana]
MGIDRSTAQRIMGIWRKSGAADPDGLRKLFLKRSVNKSTQIALQLLVDAAAGAGAFYAARSISSDQLGTWTLAAKYGFYFLAMYLFISASFEFFSLGALFYAAFRYSTNADAFLMAVQDIAGASSGLGVVDQAKQAVNIVKVLQALDQIRELLKDSAAASDTFFSDLGIYLTLERAQRLYGFQADRYGLDDAAAADIAAVFARYDTNDDGFISPEEFRRLCAENQVDLSGEEVQAAFDLLDTDKSGTLDFGEWVEWWLQKQRGYAWQDGGKPPSS